MMIAMSFERKSRHADGASTDLAKETGYPGKRTLTQDLPLIAPVQRPIIKLPQYIPIYGVASEAEMIRRLSVSGALQDYFQWLLPHPRKQK